MRRPLVIGAGGREHALAWRLAAEPEVERVIVAPGNPGMADVAVCYPDLDTTDPTAIVALAAREGVDLVVIGPEAPLVDGLADVLCASDLRVFGVGAAAARLEGSKAFCREICEAAGVPMAVGDAYDDAVAAMRAARRLGGRVAVKADGLAGGKGVVVCADRAEAEAAIRAAMVGGIFGAAGRRVVIEEALQGHEISIITLADATACLALPAARDHKRLLDGDGGPNTGGMGAISPVDDVDDALVAAIVARFHVPVLRELAARGIAFRGALFAGLMLTADGPRLLEFNTRFGDPETQSQLPRLATPLGTLLAAAAVDGLAAAAAQAGVDGPLLPVRAGASVALVLAAPGYPDATVVGGRIEGIAGARSEGALVFCAGVASDRVEGLRTAGGRVLSVVGEGRELGSAAAAAYAAADHVHFPGAQMRRDIGGAAAQATVGATA